jgi:heme exporter protein C
MWAIFHKLGSPPWLYRLSGQILRWLLPITVVALAVGLTWGLLYTAPDFRQGNSYRIIYIHVPAAVVALAGYYVMAHGGRDQPDLENEDGRHRHAWPRRRWVPP